ncbi:General vesicular transport factor p115 [Cricetulus griseus]|uniref:General vesicular transport factor p115 n=1 Tax=Cricetulus griseus TaxID=10029 RepID=G3I9F0_CRIGR|nr:General vesicular transport factor p115 [Cricetulus griseus]
MSIQKLCDRVASSTLLDDRRNAVRALKSLSKKYRLEVGIQAMEHLIHVLQTDRSDSEIIAYALDTLYNIISNDEEEEIGVSRLMDLLADSREIIRNDGVLLLQALTRSNGAIQKIVAFENAFERLLDIITDEGNSDGGIVVEDCLILLQNLLKNNNSNQNFFKEGSYIQRMKPWFEVADENSGWSAQKVTNLHLMLQLVRVLVSPTNPPGATSSCQKAMFQCGLLQQLCTILMATGIPADILTEVTTGNSVSAGQLLCGGLFSTDSLSNWCAAVALAHALQGNATQKEQLLRVQLATSIGNPPVSLLQQCTNILSQLTGQIAENLGEEEQLVQGLCALLLGISIYFNDNSLENYMKEKLKQLIEKRIGKENFIEKLGFISKHELYSRASQKPQPNFPSPEYMIFDHEFTKLVKELEGVITKAIYKSSEEDKKEEEVKKTLEQHDNIVTHYKNMIREQDLQLEELKQQVSTLKCQNEQLQTAVTQQVSQIQQHKDQYNLLKVQLGKDSHHQGSHSEGAQVNGIQLEEVSRLREEVEELKSHQGLLQSQLAEKDSLIENLKSSQASALNEQASVTASPRDSEQVVELKQELTALKSQLNSQALEITRLKAENHELLQRAEALAKSVPVQGESENVTTAKTTDVEGRLSALLQETKELKNEIKALSEEKTAIKKQLDTSNSTIAILQTEKDKLDLEVTDSKKEQDDLLVLLADQDQKILSLKSKLKNLGHPVEEEDESGDQEDDDDEMDDGDKDQDI